MAQVPTDRNAFTSYVAENLSKALLDYDVSVTSRLTLNVKQRQRAEGALQASLDRIWSYCSSNPNDCNQALTEYVTQTSKFLAERTGHVERSMIRIIVRTAGYVEETENSRPSGPGFDLVAKPFAGDLWMLCVANLAHAARLLQIKDADELGLSVDAILEIAKRNTAAGLRPLSEVTRDLPASSIGIIEGDYYESSRLALHDDWAAVAARMNGGLIVAVPSSDVVLYGDAAPPNAIDAMATLAREAAQKSKRPVSVTVFKWTKKGWEPVGP